ncbi:S1 family peptidase [Tunicatimonas pelagia]|uniref:S1 family peptidase n=1 Tax=Tunicatimonas pelagia TaxID=931531 RepID=UPI002665A6C9|nr:serine protease [Tunicatimonas pelagia]WKN46530.1 serine protease [Tunicatimonas pelagia]
MSHVRQQFSRSILRLECGGKSGTGFIIDKENGYVITAYHVIKNAIEGSKSGINGTLQGYDTNLKFRVLDHTNEDGVDLALLEPLDLSSKDFILTSLTELDVELRLPQRGEKCYLIAYSLGDFEFDVKSVEVSKYNSDGYIEALGQAYFGDSGSALISTNGSVVGISVEKKGSRIYHCIPTALAFPFFGKMKLSSQVINLDNRLKAGTVSSNEMRRYLAPGISGTSTLSNLDLILWAIKIEKSSSSYSNSKKLFDCPIMNAYWHRKLDDAAKLFLKVYFSEKIGRSYLNVGKRHLAFNEYDSAYSNITVARNLLKRSINNYISDSSSAVSEQLIMLSQEGDILPTWLKLEDIPEKRRISSSYLSALFKDYSLASFELGKISERDDAVQSEDLFGEAAQSAIASILSTDTQAFKAGGYAILGDIYLRQSRYDEALEAYYSSWENGLKTDWIQENWKFMLEKVFNEKEISKDIQIDDHKLLMGTVEKRLKY